MKRLLLLALALGLSQTSFGETTSLSTPPDTATSSTPLEGAETGSGSTVNKLKSAIGDKKFEEDERIKDLELRAYAGSYNRYSVQSNLSYSGPPSNNLADPNRPNPSNLPGDYRTYMSGSVTGRVRVSKDDAISGGTGLEFYEPVQALQGTQQRPVNRKNYDVSDPFVSFDHSYAYGHLQMRSAVSATAITTLAYVQQGEWGEGKYTQYFKWNPADTRWILGFLGEYDYFAYDRDYRSAATSAFPKDSFNDSKFYLSFIPSVEYKLSDKVNFNTSVDYAYANRRSDNSWWHPESSWWVGVGYAITPVIYVKPYVSFYMESPSFNTASANISTTFSIF